MDTRGVKLTWLGHATFKIQTPAGKTILIDPWVAGNPACPEKLKTFDQLDVMLITHGHFDHMGDAVALAKKYKPTVVAIFEVASWLEAKGVENTSAMNKGGTQKVDDIEVTMVDARHSGAILDNARLIYGGEPAGYVVRFANGFTLYHAGDTEVFGDMKIIGELYQPALALLPIGDHFTMGPRAAAYAIRLLGVKAVVPMHFGTFPLLTGTPEALREQTKDIEALEIITLKPGETLG